MAVASGHPSGVGRIRHVPGWWRDVSGAAFWLINLFVVALWVADGGVSLLSSKSGFLTGIGQLSGLIASALLLIQVFLMARVPWFEQAWGQDELARLHRLVGFTSFNLMLVHIIFITLGYASGSTQGLWGTIVDFVVNYPGMLLAIAGTAALFMVVFTSFKAVRRRLRYESWHLIHLYAYLGVGLALPHQLWTGQDFLKSTASTVFWWTLYALALAAVLVFRVGLPAWRSLRAPIRVRSIVQEKPGTVSVTVDGQGVARLRAQGGQFFTWRFLDGPGWSRGNPYSLSAAPDGHTLRFTADIVGDGSARLTTLTPGTRVLLEGPYGRMHPGTRTQRKVLLLGAGIGITPMRALLESLPQAPGDVTIAYRISRREDLVLSDEIDALAGQRGAQYVLVEGHRVRDRHSWLPEKARNLSDEQALLQLCPDLTERDIYVCGALGWMEAVHAAARAAGVPEAQIHIERFEY